METVSDLELSEHTRKLCLDLCAVINFWSEQNEGKIDQVSLHSLPFNCFGHIMVGIFSQANEGDQEECIKDIREWLRFIEKKIIPVYCKNERDRISERRTIQ